MASQYLIAACLVTLIVFGGLLLISNAQSIGDIRLSSSCSGRLEVYLNSLTHGERWYQVCDRGMNDTEARVICRQLGCPSTYATTTHASFGYTIIVYYVSRGYRCLGTEQSISSCRQVSGRCTSTSIDGGDNDHVAISCQSSTPPPPPPPPTPSPIDGCVGGRQCLGFSSYCPSNGRYSATCVNGSCRCVGQKNRDYCTCLPRVGSCHIQKGLPAAVGTATYRRESQTIYSCAATDNCMYDVHVVSSYESISSFSHTAGTATVNLRVSGPSQDAKPLVLIFVTYEPVRWILNVPSGVIIDKVLLGSYYLETSSVSGVSSHIIERIPRPTLPSGYGDDSGGGRTDKLLMYVTDRFGPVASFSGTYRADYWELVIQRTPIESNCMQSTLNETELGDVRLSDGCTGELEIYLNAEGWYRVCAASSGFSDRESQVVCKQLGCPVNGASSTFTRSSVSSLPSLTARFTCYGRESALSECQETIDRCSDANIITVRCANIRDPGINVDSGGGSDGGGSDIELPNNKYDSEASVSAGGIAVGVVVVCIGCIFALFIGMACYKKGVCIKSTPRPSQLTRNNTYPTTYVTPAAPSGTQHLYQQPQHPYRLQPSNVHSTSTTLEEPSHLKAATHAGEAPPAYHAAMHYETVILEDNKDLKLSEDSAVYRAKPAPPTYSEIISGQEDNLVNHE